MNDAPEELRAVVSGLHHVAIVVRSIAGVLACTVALTAGAQRATERYIPIGESPGITSYIGEIVAVDMSQRTMTIAEDGDRHVGVYNAGRYWHTDLSYMEAPSRGSLLYALEVPFAGGRALGDTCFASTAAAYDALPEETKRRIAGLRATFSLAHQRAKLRADGDTEAVLTEEQQAKTPVVTHNVVQEHPLTGRKCLFVNEGHTIELVGLPAEERRTLLAELCRHCTRPEFVYRHRWAVGDLLMWDNIPTQHLASFDYHLPQRRHMHRTTLVGSRLAGSQQMAA